MLTVYSTHGSPGASTTAIYLAAQWASSGRQVLLVESDAAAGSLSQMLGIQFTPGTASFMAAGKPANAASLIEHAQDVLFSNFHVMPTPSSPSGAKTVAEKFARLGEELRDISDAEMAIIVDGGRLSPEARTSELTTSAAAVLIVARDDAQIPSLEYVDGILVDDPFQPGPLGLVATVGPSPLSGAEWSANHRLSLVGSVDLSSERGTDLSMFMARGKRKSRKMRGSIEKLADVLYEYACPANAAAQRERLPANRPEPAAPAAAPADAEEAPDAAGPGDLLAGVSLPDASAAPAPGAAMPPMPSHAHYDPLGPAAHQQGVSAQYGQPLSAAPAHEPPAAPDYRQPPYSQQGYPDSGYPAPGHLHGGYAQHPPPPDQQPQPHYPAPPPGHAPHGYDYGSPGSQAYGQPAPPTSQQPQQPPDQAPMPSGEAPTVPTGSFRTWAAHLFGDSAGSEAVDEAARPGTGATA